MALVAIAAAGCGESGERPSAPNPVEEAATKFERALESGDCKALADVGHQHVVPAERLADLPQRARRLHRERAVVLGGLEAAEHDLVEA